MATITTDTNTIIARPRRAADTPPERSREQRLEALAKANDVRKRRARLKRELKYGAASIADVLLDPPAWLETAKVYEILLAVPKVGRVKVNRMLRACAISPSKTIGGLSQRQRGELIDRIRGLPTMRPRGS